jgi:hypothetical protein
LLAEAVLIVKIFGVIEFYSPPVAPDTASIQGIGPNGIDSTRGCGTGARIIRPGGWSNGIGNSDGRHAKGWGKGKGERGKQATWHVSASS